MAEPVKFPDIAQMSNDEMEALQQQLAVAHAGAVAKVEDHSNARAALAMWKQRGVEANREILRTFGWGFVGGCGLFGVWWLFAGRSS